MKGKLKKDQFLFLFFAFLGITLIVLLSCLIILFRYQEKQEENFYKSYQSYVIAREMRQSSDDLTKMVRLYVLTNNKKYLDAYNEILSIRNGTSFRPVDYDQVYWDFVLDPNKRPRPYGAAISLQQLMRNQGFSQEEFDLIEESQKRSDTLVQMEEEAIHAMQGQFNNGSGDYVVTGPPNLELARRLVSDQEYMNQKAQIMEPLFIFSEKVKQRQEKEEKELQNKSFRVIIWSILFALFAAVMMIICLFKSMRLIASAFQTSEDLLLNMLPSSIVDRFKKGEETVIDEYKASVLFVQIDHLEDSFSSDTMSAIFDQLDALVEKFRVEKIQVVGESQVIVSGIPAPIKDHEILLADFALELKKQIEDFNQDKGFSLHIRMGMSSGTVIAGFVGDKKFVYDLWGDVVTLANALESCSVAGEIQISESMAHILGNSFELEERGVIELPELGSLKTYFLKERKMGSKSFL